MATTFPANSYGEMIVNTPGVTNYWRLDDFSNAIILDHVGVAHGQPVNVGFGGGSAIAGDAGHSIFFTGSNSYINFGNVVPLIGNFTIELWVYPGSPAGSSAFPTFFSKENYNVPYSGYGFYLDKASMQAHFVRFTGNPQITNRVQSGSALPFHQWTHLVVTYTGSRMYMYRNGTLVWDTPASGTINQSNYSLIMGGSSNINSTFYSDYFYGHLDDISIYNVALSSATILQHYQKGITAPILPVYGNDYGYIGSFESRGDMHKESNIVETSVLGAIETISQSRTATFSETASFPATETANVVTTIAAILVNGNDAGTLGSTASFSAVTTTLVSDESPVSLYEELEASANMSIQDTSMLRSGTGSLLGQFILGASRLGGEDIARIRPIIDVSILYPELVIRRRMLMHIAAQRSFNGHISIEYQHNNAIYGDVPSEEYFLVRNSFDLPVALGKVTTNWSTQLTIVDMLPNVDDYPEVMEQFGYFSPVQG